jgi:hemerythrin-like domain-containing protein
MATATMKGKDAIALLKEDHKKVKDLFDKFEKAKNSDEKERICQEAIKELKIHTTIEEEIFYPTVRQALGQEEEDAELLNEAAEEHRVAKTIIEALEDMSADDEDFEAKFTVLAENVRHHIKEEEGELFPEARDADLDFKELGGKMQGRKEELMSNESELEQAVESSDVKPYQELG